MVLKESLKESVKAKSKNPQKPLEPRLQLSHC